MSDIHFDHSSYNSGNGNGNNGGGGYYANSRPGEPPSGNYSYGPDDEIDLMHLFSILMRRKWAVMGITALFTFGALFYAFTATPVYESNGSIIISDTKSNSWRAGGSDLGSLLSTTYGVGLGSTIGNELQIMRSRRMSNMLAERAMQKESMENGRRLPILWEDFPNDSTIVELSQVASRIRNNIIYEQVDRDTEVIEIRFQSYSPKEAQWMVDEAINAYSEISTTQNRQAASSAMSFLTEEREEIEQELQEKEQQLKQFMDRSGIVAVDGQTEQLISRISDLESQRQQVRTRLVAINSAIQNYERQIEEIRPGLADQFAEGVGSSMERLQFQLAELETERMLLLNRNPGLRENPEREPQMVQINDEIAMLKKEINKVASQLVDESEQYLSFLGSSDGGIAGRLMELRSKLIELNVEKTQYEAQQEVLDERLAEENRFFENLPENMVEFARLKRDVEINEQLFLTISDQYAETAFWEQTQFGLGRPVDYGNEPREPVEPKIPLIGLIGLILGGVTGVGYAFGRETLTKVIDGTEKMRRLNYPVLSVIPDIQKVIGEKFEGRDTISVEDSKMVSSSVLTLVDSISPVAESFRRLHNNIVYSQPDQEFQTILVTSSAQGEGKTTLVSNLAVALSESGKKVLMIDLDLRRPNLHNLWKESHRPGVVELLFEDVTLDEAIRPTAARGIDVLTAGQETPNPSAINQSDSLRKLITDLKKRYDHILIDTAPYGIITDAAPIMRLADGIIVAAKFAQTKESQLVHTLENLERIRAQVLGTVLTGFDHKRSSDYYYGNDSYYYAYETYDKYHEERV
jgi:capsular exopolysaccharide synthesis family protein